VCVCVCVCVHILYCVRHAAHVYKHMYIQIYFTCIHMYIQIYFTCVHM
jgi:hypothetical protein